MVVRYVSAVASDRDRWLCDRAEGLASVSLLLSEPLPGEGRVCDREDVENVELAGDKSDISSLQSEDLLDRVHDAKAARCSGKQPCRVSLSRQASGFISIKTRIKRQSSMNGSSSIGLESMHLTVLVLAARS